MRNLSIRQRILASFGLIIAAMVVMGGLAYTGLANIGQQAINVQEHSIPALYYSNQLQILWKDNFTLTQQLVTALDRASLDKTNRELTANAKNLQDLLTKYEATFAGTDEQSMLHTLMTLRGPYENLQEKIIKVASDLKAVSVASSVDQAALAGQAAAQLRLLGSNFTHIHNAIQNLANTSKTNADVAAARIIASVGSAKFGIVVSFAAALLLAAWAGIYLLRAVTRPLGGLVTVMDGMRQGDFTQRITRRDEFGALGEGFNRMADELTGLFSQVQKSGIQVGSSVTQIAATAKQQQATASEIAATTTEIGATSKEISATSRELLRTMNDVSKVAEDTATLAGGGRSGLERMEETMHHVMQAAGSINDKLAVLSEKAGNINQVVTTITKVADQTNLLSLNAAIEAEKAGEYGRGFTVVASEIRRLADQTAVATYDIEQMVKEIQSAVSAGVMGMDKFSEEVRHGMEDVQQVGGQLSQIIERVQALVPRFENVNEGMQAQATGAEQITEALLQLTEAAQQTVESLRESSTAIDDLNQVSGSLRGSVSRFKLEAA